MAAAIPWIGLGISAFSTGMSAWGQHSAGEDAKEIGFLNAGLAMQDTAEELESSRESYSMLMSRQRAGYAKAGVDVNTGSPLLMYFHTARKEISDQIKIRKRGEKEAEIYRKGGAAKQKAMNINAFTTVLTGIGQGALTGWQLAKGV